MTLIPTIQTPIKLNTLYEVLGTYGEFTRQKRSSIWINTGLVDMWGSNSDIEPTAMSEIGGMTLNSQDTLKGGIIPIYLPPRYIAIKQNSGTTTKIISTGMTLKEIKEVL